MPARTINLGETTYLEYMPQHCPKANLPSVNALQPHTAGCNSLVQEGCCSSPPEHPSPGYLSDPVKHKPGTIRYSRASAWLSSCCCLLHGTAVWQVQRAGLGQMLIKIC